MIPRTLIALRDQESPRRPASAAVKVIVGLALIVVLVAQPGFVAAEPVAAPSHQRAPATTSTTRGTPNLGKLPLSFVTNQGQVHGSVRFHAQSTTGASFFFTPNQVVWSFASEDAAEKPGRAAQLDVRVQFEKAKARDVLGLDELPGKVNYLKGADRAAWRTGLSTYGRIVYQELYPGIDLEYSGATGQLMSTYHVAAGADPANIRLRYVGARNLHVDEAGDLVLTLARGDRELTLRETGLKAWQNIDGQQVPVRVAFALSSDRSVGFTLGNYDRRQPLTIDPTLTYSTFLGGSGHDAASSIAIDSVGNAYVTGETRSASFPAPSGAAGSTSFQSTHALDRGSYDAFVAKLSADGKTLLYSTYLGGSGSDRGYAIAVDGSGVAYVTGETDSADFPTQNPLPNITRGGRDAFVAKLSEQGSALLFSTSLGHAGTDVAEGIAVDNSGNAYVTGWTDSSNFPTQNPLPGITRGGRDAFVAKVSTTTSTLAYSTYYGGSADDAATDIAVDSGGSAYIVGHTDSGDLRAVSARQPQGGGRDAFIAQIGSTGSVLNYSTWLGGSSTDEAHGIALGSGFVYIAGHTDSSNFPTLNGDPQLTRGGDRDAFVGKLSLADATQGYVSYLGGSGSDSAYGIAVDSTGAAYVTGSTRSTNFPVLSARQWTKKAASDAFVTRLNADGTRKYSTYLGGSGDDVGNDIAVHNSTGTATDGFAYAAGYTTSAYEFPTSSPLQASYGGDGDGFVAKLKPTGSGLVFNTYLGGFGDEAVRGITTDAAGHVYLTGLTGSAGFPTTDGALQRMGAGGYDAFVTKLDADGRIVFSTYFGGRRNDKGKGIGIDGTGNIYVAGETESTDLPLGASGSPYQAANGGKSDTFVVKFNQGGNVLLAGTYLGGSEYDNAYDLAVDSAGNAYVTGDTNSTNFPATANVSPTTVRARFDVFVAKLAPNLNALMYGTYLGGNADDSKPAIAVDGAGNAYVTGTTKSSNFPTANALQAGIGGGSDAFVAKLNTDGNGLVYSTYLGGLYNDGGSDIAVGVDGSAYVAGEAYSTNFPTTAGAYQPARASGVNEAYDAFVTKLNAAGNGLVYSTYLGGGNEDKARGIAVDGQGNAYVTGHTSSYVDAGMWINNFPARNAGQLQAAPAGSYDAFVTVFNAAGSGLLFSAYLGGSSEDYGICIAADGNGNAYVAGQTLSSNFLTANAAQPANGGYFDAFVTKINVQQ